MKKLILLVVVLVLALLIVPVVTAEQCTSLQELNQERLQVKSDFANYRAERHMLGMDEIITYAKEQGKDTAELERLRTQFEAKNNELRSATTQNQFNELVQEMKQTTTQFREEVHLRLSTNDRTQARDRIQLKLQEQDGYLNGLLGTAYQNGQSHMQARFDATICVSENAVERLKAQGADVTDLESDLTALKAKRASLSEKMKAAAIACADTPYGRCNTLEKTQYESAKNEFKNDFNNFKNKYQVQVRTQAKAGTSSEQGQTSTDGSDNGQGGAGSSGQGGQE